MQYPSYGARFISVACLILAPGCTPTTSTVNNLSRVTYQTSFDVSEGGIQTGSVSCQAGEQLLSGGYVMGRRPPDIPLDAVVTENFPSSPTTWRVTVSRAQLAPRSAYNTVFVYVNCLHGNTLGAAQIGSLTTAVKLKDISDQGTGAAQACAGAITGGGYQEVFGQPAEITDLVAASFPTLDGKGIPNAWEVLMKYSNNGKPPNVTVTLTVFAVCTPKPPAGAPVIAAKVSSIFMNQQDYFTGTATPCGQGQLLVGGGYDGVAAGLKQQLRQQVNANSITPDGLGWTVKLIDVPPYNVAPPTVYGVCVSIP